MNRSAFLKNLFGASLSPAVALAHSTPANRAAEAQRVRRELLDAWAMSEKMTLVTAGQMPADSFGFKYTPEAMSYAQQWAHCCTFTTLQLVNELGLEDPYKTRQMPTEMDKQQVLTELKALYTFVRQTIENLPDAKLFEEVDYVGDTIPGWRLFSCVENHIIHHRGQCMVYLRLQGVAPEGYIGW